MKHHHRIAALQCNFQTREQTLAMPERWRELGFDVEQLLHTHADLYSAVYDPALHGALLDEYRKRAEACDLALILYMNCHILGPSLEMHRDDWCMRQPDGTPIMCYDGTYPACCLNSGWRHYFLDCLARIPEVAGVFLDGPMEEMCHCPRCRAQFRDAYGIEPEEATTTQQRDFALQTKLRFQMEVRQTVKARHPEWIVYFNEGLFAGSGNAAYYRQLLDCNDWIATEGGFFFFGEPRLAAYWVCAKNAKLLEAVADGKPTVIFFAGDHKPWSWFLHTPAETRLCYMTALANGANVWYGLHCAPEALDSATGEAVRELVRFDQKHDALYQASESLAQVAIYYSFDTAAQTAGNGGTADFYGRGVKAASAAALRSDYTMAVDGACALLEHLTEPYDFVADLTPERLRRYAVILLPACSALSLESEAALRQYLHDGGTVIADAEFAWSNPTEWAGFTRSGRFIEHRDCNYYAVDPEIYRVDNAFGWMPCPPWSCELESVEAEVVGRSTPVLPGRYAGKPEAARTPFFLRRRIGRGAFYYCAGNFFEFYFRYTHVCQREFVRALLKRHGSNPFRLHGGAEGISMTVRQSGSAIVIHLLNYVSAVRPIRQSAPQNHLRLDIPAGYSARELTGDIALPRNADGRLQLPELREFLVIELRPEEDK